MKQIYYLRWNEKSLLLRDGDDPALMRILESEEIRVLHGPRLNEENLKDIKTSLKVGIERGVNRWISDSRFFLHCLMSAGVFLVSYYFLSYVIRDPLPLVDEIVLSAILGVLAFFRLRDQDYRSEKALARKLELEQGLADLPCESSPFVRDVELYLEKLAAMDDKERKNLSDSGGVPVFFSAEKKELLGFYKALNRQKSRILPVEARAMKQQIREYLKYHSSMV